MEEDSHKDGHEDKDTPRGGSVSEAQQGSSPEAVLHGVKRLGSRKVRPDPPAPWLWCFACADRGK